MILTVEALTASVALSDPNPVDGGWSTYVELGATKSKAISQGQLERMTAALVNLETAGKIAWSVAQDPAQDMRSEDGTSQPIYVAGLDAVNTDATGGATLKIFGAGLLTDFASASHKVSVDVSNYINYTSKAGATGNKVSVAHVQGAGSLSVAVVGNAITVTLAAASSTLAQVASAIAAAPTAAALVIATVTGSGTAPVAATALLTGGKGSTIGVKIGGVACAVTKLTDTEIDVTVPALSPLIATNQAIVLVSVGPHTMVAGVLTLV